MTSTIDAPDTITRTPLSYGKVFGHARTGTVELTKATGGLAFLLLRGSWSVLRSQAARARAADTTPAALAATAGAADRGKKRKKLALIAGGTALAVLAAGGAAVIQWGRRRTPPEPASAPPSLTSVKPAGADSPSAPEPDVAARPSGTNG